MNLYAKPTYDVYVKPKGGNEVMIADDYLFRNPDNIVDNWAAFSGSSSIDVCNATILKPFHVADTDSSGAIELDELNNYIQLWIKTTDISLPQLIEVVELWKDI